jgi:hypothetical protein
MYELRRHVPAQDGRGPQAAAGRRSVRRTPLRRGRRIRRREPEPISLEERALAGEFHRHTVCRPCVVCGRTQREARAAMTRITAHHAISQQALRRLGLPLWDPRLGVPVCWEPCHRRHTSRHTPIRRSQLPPEALDFAREHGLEYVIEREYPE